MEYLHLFNTKSEHDSLRNGNNYKEPWLAYVRDEALVTGNKPHDYSKDYLTFKALEDASFTIEINKSLTIVSFSYSIDNGKTWVNIASETPTPTVTAGNKILFKAVLDGASDFGYITSTGRYEAMGNPYSMLYGDNFRGKLNIRDKSNLLSYMFAYDINLVSAENLSLPATTFTDNCYEHMFAGCTSLTTAPELPATTLESSCYFYMFDGCASLTTAPELPAETISMQCYCGMFQGCTALTAAPELPAAKLKYSSYGEMFNGCTNLNYIKCLATDISASYCTNNWVSGVAANGTFVKASSMTSWKTTGASGIPSGWAVQDT